MQARQGDVFLVSVSRIPKAAEKMARKPGQRVIVAEGEATGHHHAIADRGVEAFSVADAANEVAFLRVTSDEGVKLTHEEHSTILLEKGNYEVRRQREYTPQEIRRVYD